jgi:hypothetical protein
MAAMGSTSFSRKLSAEQVARFGAEQQRLKAAAASRRAAATTPEKADPGFLVPEPPPAVPPRSKYLR